MSNSMGGHCTQPPALVGLHTMFLQSRPAPLLHSTIESLHKHDLESPGKANRDVENFGYDVLQELVGYVETTT